MELRLVSLGYVPYLRRRIRPSGLRITVRWGRVYTIAPAETHQPDTEAQLRSRSLLSRASALAKRELADPSRRLYWDTHAAGLGYKTARGACIAHHIRRLKLTSALLDDDIERLRRKAAAPARRFAPPYRQFPFPPKPPPLQPPPQHALPTLPLLLSNQPAAKRAPSVLAPKGKTSPPRQNFPQLHLKHLANKHASRVFAPAPQHKPPPPPPLL